MTKIFDAVEKSLNYVASFIKFLIKIMNYDGVYFVGDTRRYVP